MPMKKQRLSLPGGFVERGSIISSISKTTQSSFMSTNSLVSNKTKKKFSKMTSEEIELEEIKNKRKEKEADKMKKLKYFQKMQEKN